MNVLTTIPGETTPRVGVELLDCVIDLPNCAPYNTSDWYTVRYLYGGDEAVVAGDMLGLIVIVDDLE